MFVGTAGGLARAYVCNSRLRMVSVPFTSNSHHSLTTQKPPCCSETHALLVTVAPQRAHVIWSVIPVGQRRPSPLLPLPQPEPLPALSSARSAFPAHTGPSVPASLPWVSRPPVPPTRPQRQDFRQNLQNMYMRSPLSKVETHVLDRM